MTFPFRFAPRWRRPLLLFGVTPSRAFVEVDEERLLVRFGPWKLETALSNVCHTERGGPYQWFRVLGPHLSGKDSGVTFGTSIDEGLCICFHEPVPAIDPFGLRKHRAVTVTVEDIDRLEAALAQSRK